MSKLKLYDFPIGSLVEYKNMHGVKSIGRLIGFFKRPNGPHEFYEKPRALIEFPCVITTNPLTDKQVCGLTDYIPVLFDLEASEPSKEDINIRAKEINAWKYPYEPNQWVSYNELFPVNDIKNYIK